MDERELMSDLQRRVSSLENRVTALEHQRKNTKDKKLDVCPFCHRLAAVLLPADGGQFQGYCKACGARGASADDPDAARKLWNSGLRRECQE